MEQILLNPFFFFSVGPTNVGHLRIVWPVRACLVGERGSRTRESGVLGEKSVGWFGRFHIGLDATHWERQKRQAPRITYRYVIFGGDLEIGVSRNIISYYMINMILVYSQKRLLFRPGIQKILKTAELNKVIKLQRISEQNAKIENRHLPGVTSIP